MRRCEEDRLFFEGGGEEQEMELVQIEHNDNDADDDDEYEYEDYVGNDDRGVSGAMSRIYDT